MLDYNTNFKTANVIATLFAPDEFRTSDHDRIVVGLDLSSFAVTTTASPAFLHPANGKDRQVNLRSMADRGRHTNTTILGVDPADGVTVLGDESLKLRADAGVTYSIWVLTTSGGQSVLTVVSVPVLASAPAFGKVK